jgi:hypothetical protein
MATAAVMKVTIPCATRPPEIFYVGEKCAGERKGVVSVDLKLQTGKCRATAVVASADHFGEALPKAKNQFPSFVAYTRSDGVTLVFAPVKTGVIVGVYPCDQRTTTAMNTMFRSSIV